MAFSRTIQLENLHAKKFDPKKIKVSNDVKSEMERLRSKQYDFQLQFMYNVESTLKVAFVNAQSLHKNLHDVQHDQTLSRAIFSCALKPAFIPQMQR